MQKARTVAGLGVAMGWVVSLLIQALVNRRRRTYTVQELDQIKRAAAARDETMGLPAAIEKPKKPHRWWRYTGLH